MSTTQESNPRGKKGSKFAQIRAQEAARKAARTVASGVAQAAGKVLLDAQKLVLHSLLAMHLRMLWLSPKPAFGDCCLDTFGAVYCLCHAVCMHNDRNVFAGLLAGLLDRNLSQMCLADSDCMHTGAEPDSAAEGVDTAVGEATQFAKTGSTTKTQSKSNDPKVCSNSAVVHELCCSHIVFQTSICNWLSILVLQNCYV